MALQTIPLYTGSKTLDAACAADLSFNIESTMGTTGATWATFQLQAHVINGDSDTFKPGERITIWAATSTFDATDIGISFVRAIAKPWTFTLPLGAVTECVFHSPIYPNNGGYLYTWIQYDPWAFSRTFELYAVQSLLTAVPSVSS